MQVDASALTLRDAAKEIKRCVMQNRRFDNAAFNPSRLQLMVTLSFQVYQATTLQGWQ